MIEKSQSDCGSDARHPDDLLFTPGVNDWFVHEVLPLEAALMSFLRRSWRNKSDVEDLCHDVYVRVYEAAKKQIPHPVKAFVFTTARNLLVDRLRHEHVIAIEAVADLDALGVAVDEPGPDSSVIAREELRRLQAALDRVTPRCREAVVLRKIEGLSYREIAVRMGITEKTVDGYLTDGLCVLADILYGENPPD
jgi:RNA polymerase sigma-70 factor (ECF subfamily)